MESFRAFVAHFTFCNSVGLSWFLHYLRRLLEVSISKLIGENMSGAKKNVFLILDNLRGHHSKPVKAWLAEHQEQIEVFYLPSYSPQLNPDERLNADLKQAQALGSRVQVRTEG